MVSHTRRTVLAALASVGLAGCTSITNPDAQDEDELPDQCPTSQDLDVGWPRDLTTESAAEFVTEYEEAYLSEQEQGDSEFVAFNIDIQLNQGVSRFFRGFSPYLTGGFRITVNSRGSVEHHVLKLTAVEANPDGTPKYPDDPYVPEDSLLEDPDFIPIDEIMDQRLRATLKRAADPGAQTTRVTSTSEIERYADLVGNLPTKSSSEDNRVAYFDVDGTLVVLIAKWKGGGVGLWKGSAHYYVTENVVWRNDEEDGAPRDGTLVECRPPE
ncbi:hypothetical protein ACOZ35_11340 [Halorubrum xinjiangense]|uniref:hypothetical protein n=1 Tax=Halorubrum xinjiangense TaxID=261291 RepID=UPI003C6EB89F